MKLIDQYLDRVRVYLPLDSEDAIVELQTHLIEEAERIGGGTMTAGSAMMAIERMGDPKSVAHEYAGSGEKVGPVPAEYANPLGRMLVVIASVALALIIGASMIGVSFSQLVGSDIQNWPLNIPLTILINLIFLSLIFGGISMLDRNKPLTEKTTLESFFGIGVDGFKPKGRWDAAGDLVFGIIWAVVLVLPPVVALYTEGFSDYYMALSIFLILGAIRGALFYIGGENNLNLTFEAVLSVVWIGLAVILIGVGWPVQYVYANTNGVWYRYDIFEFFTNYEIPFVPFDWIWAFIMFITVAIAVWRIIISSMKITMHFRAGRGLWWQGSWGESRRLRRPFWRRVLGDQDTVQEGRIYHDGYRDSDESQ
jgi:hypothetical protein